MLNYKIGICLLNDPYQKDKAIQYLLDASHNINPSYKENSLKERAAPSDVLYYLGNAYLVNELLENAIESYKEFLEVMDQDVYDEELVLDQIRSCRNAQGRLNMPVDIDLTLIDSPVNTPYSDIHPVVSGDGTKLAFVTKLPFFDGAFYAEKGEDGWSSPQMITQLLGFDKDVYPVALSYDGTEMILYFDDDYIGNLYYSRMEDGLWTPATKMGENISTKFWESHACFSKDGQTLYFTSNRKGTNGGLDIYLSEKQSDGKWGPPLNLGTAINTRYNEECPYISEDGQTLYFSSYGHYNMGGYDIFYCRKNADGTWAEPVNAGYPINTTDDNLYFQPFDNGNAAYYSIYSPSGVGRHDIYYMNIYSANNPRLYSVSGNLRTEDGSIDSTRMAIYVIDSDSGDTLTYTTPTEEGAFAFHLKQGIYELHFTGEGSEELIRPLQITDGSNKQGISLENNLQLSLAKEEAETEEEPELFIGDESDIKLKETQFDELTGAAVLVPVVVGSIAAEEVSQDLIMQEGSDEQAGAHGIDPELVDLLLAEAVSDGDTGLLRYQLIEQATGPLKDYLLQMDMKAEGIQSSEDFLKHLEKVAELMEFSMDDVRKAMLQSLKMPLEVYPLYQVLLQTSNETTREVLESLDFHGNEIHTSAQLIDLISMELGSRGLDKKERIKILSELFEEDYSVDESSRRKTAWPLLLLFVVAGAGIIWFIIAWWRGRKKGEKQSD